jgi:hypothetical protein
MPPGRYTVTLSAGGREMSQSLELRKDPNSSGTEADIKQKAELHRDFSGELDGVVEMINTVEVARAQLIALKATVNQADVKTAAESLEKKLIGVEEELVQLRITGRGQDLIRYQAKLAEKFVYLINDLNGSDNPATEPERNVGNVLKERSRAARAALNKVMNDDVETFNRMLREKGLAGIISNIPKTSD